jgi:CRISPR-associated protein Cmr1
VKQIEATYRIVTPMFLGGADTGKLADSIRPPSVKGALRFWWRALTWAERRAKASDDEAALREMHKQEAALFGSASTEGGGGQSAFILRTALQEPIRTAENNWPRRNTGSGYLGLGLFASGSIAKGTSQPQRPAIHEGGTFKVLICFRRNSSDEDVQGIIDALRIFGLLGGLGGRGQRRGFGSVAIEGLNDENTRFANATTYLAALRTVISKAAVARELPPYTALGAHTRIELIAESGDARAVHNQMGMLYRDYRGYNPNRDRRTSLRGEQKLPFGLPLAGVDEESRRASPLLFHVHPTSDGKYQGIAAFIPARFHYLSKYESVSYQLVEDFLKPRRPATEAQRP